MQGVCYCFLCIHKCTCALYQHVHFMSVRVQSVNIRGSDVLCSPMMPPPSDIMFPMMPPPSDIMFPMMPPPSDIMFPYGASTIRHHVPLWCLHHQTSCSPMVPPPSDIMFPYHAIACTCHITILDLSTCCESTCYIETSISIRGVCNIPQSMYVLVLKHQQ